MRSIPFAWTLAIIAAGTPGHAAAGETKAAATSKSWSFDAETPDKPPTGFSFGRTGSGAAGRWVVRAEKDAPSGGQVLAQLDADATDYRFPVAAADALSLKDLRLSVRCKAVSGSANPPAHLPLREAGGRKRPSPHTARREAPPASPRW